MNDLKSGKVESTQYAYQYFSTTPPVLAVNFCRPLGVTLLDGFDYLPMVLGRMVRFGSQFQRQVSGAVTLFPVSQHGLLQPLIVTELQQ